MTDTTLIERLRALLAKATPALAQGKASAKQFSRILHRGVTNDPALLRFASTDFDADAALIVAAVNALPSLLDRLEAAEGGGWIPAFREWWAEVGEIIGDQGTAQTSFEAGFNAARQPLRPAPKDADDGR